MFIDWLAFCLNTTKGVYRDSREIPQIAYTNQGEGGAITSNKRLHDTGDRNGGLPFGVAKGLFFFTSLYQLGGRLA